MKLEYVVFTRTGNPTSTNGLPKSGQGARRIQYFVRKEHAKRFSTLGRDLGLRHIAMADLVFVDGRLMKNRWGNI